MALHDRDYMRESPSRQLAGGITAFHVILALNTLVFVLQYGFGEFGQSWGTEFYPFGGISVDGLARGQIWTLFSYMFVHGGMMHFVLNMLMLWFAGRGVQKCFGGLHLTLIYLFSGIAGAAAEMTVNGIAHGDTFTPLVGASASAFGLLIALAVARPEEQITAFIYFIIPVHMRLWTLAKSLLIIQFVLGLTYILFNFMPEGMKIAYFAHLGGAAAGWFYARSMGYGGRPMTYASQWQPESPHMERKPHMARAKRARQALDLEETATAPSLHRGKSPSDAVTSLMEEVVNPLLDKINQHGRDSLTDEEKRLLERASQEVRRHRHG